MFVVSGSWSAEEPPPDAFDFGALGSLGRFGAAALAENPQTAMPVTAAAPTTKATTVEVFQKFADRVIETLREEGLARGRDGLELYMMCEIPSNVVLAGEFARRFDGFSIGSNDLTQYVLAADRNCVEFGRSQYDHPGGNRSADPTAHIHAPVLGLIERAARWGLDRNIEVSICGEVASAPECLADLLRVGIRSLTVSPAALGRVKKFLARKVRLRSPE